MSAVEAPSSVLVGLELAINGTELTPRAKGDIIPLFLTRAELGVNSEGVTVIGSRLLTKIKKLIL